MDGDFDLDTVIAGLERADPRYTAALRFARPGEWSAEKPPSWGSDASIWAEAAEAVLEDIGDYPELLPLVAAVYVELGGEIRGKLDRLAGLRAKP